MTAQVKVQGGGYVECTPHFDCTVVLEHPIYNAVKTVKAGKGQVTAITVVIGGVTHRVSLGSMFVELEGGRLMVKGEIEVYERNFEYLFNTEYGLADSEVELVQDDDGVWYATSD